MLASSSVNGGYGPGGGRALIRGLNRIIEAQTGDVCAVGQTQSSVVERPACAVPIFEDSVRLAAEP
jgi:hypothetical protein